MTGENLVTLYDRPWSAYLVICLVIGNWLFPFSRCFYFLLYRKDFYRTWQWKTWTAIYKTLEPYTLHEQLRSPLAFWSICVGNFFSFLCFVLVLSHVCSEVACVSRLSILDCVFRLLWIAFTSLFYRFIIFDFHFDFPIIFFHWVLSPEFIIVNSL